MSISDPDNQSLERVKVDINPRHLFSHESRLKKEAKGGYLDGKIELGDLNWDKVELSLTSNIHHSRQHCNFLHITDTGYKRDKKFVKSVRGDNDWKISLTNDQGTIRLDDDQHEYRKNEFMGNFFDESSNTLLLGRGKLQLTIGIPLSKSNNDFKKKLRQRTSSEKDVEDIGNLCKSGEPFMHLAHLKVTVKLKGSSEVVTGLSKLICDRGRYEVNISDIPGNIVLNNCALQRYIIGLNKCMPLEKVSFSCSFVYADLMNKEQKKVKVNEDEIKVIYTHRIWHEKKCVEVYFSTNCGEILSSVMAGKYKLYLQLRMIENGNLGSAVEYCQLISETNINEIELGQWINHDCMFDYRLRNIGIVKIDKILVEVSKLQKELEKENSSFRSQCGECSRTIANMEQLNKVSKCVKLGGVRKRHVEDNVVTNAKTSKIPKISKNIIHEISKETGNIKY